MSEENEKKDGLGYEIKHLGSDMGVLLHGCMKFEKADERSKDVKDNELEIEVTFSLSNGRVVSRTTIPAILTGVAGEIAGSIGKDMDRNLTRMMKERKAFDAGFEAGKEAAKEEQKHATDEPKPDNNPTPEGAAASTDTPANG